MAGADGSIYKPRRPCETEEDFDKLKFPDDFELMGEVPAKANHSSQKFFLARAMNLKKL